MQTKKKLDRGRKRYKKKGDKRKRQKIDCTKQYTGGRLKRGPGIGLQYWRKQEEQVKIKKNNVEKEIML